MSRALLAGTIYFLVVFAVAFVLGTVRTLVLLPRFGTLISTMAEAPVMLAIGYWTCRWVLGRWPVKTGRWLMVSTFLTMLALFEWQLGIRLFGLTAAQQWANLTTPAGLVGLTAQILVALFPLMLVRQQRQEVARPTTG
jgi:hypothetical protein